MKSNKELKPKKVLLQKNEVTNIGSFYIDGSKDQFLHLEYDAYEPCVFHNLDIELNFKISIPRVPLGWMIDIRKPLYSIILSNNPYHYNNPIHKPNLEIGINYAGSYGVRTYDKSNNSIFSTEMIPADFITDSLEVVLKFYYGSCHLYLNKKLINLDGSGYMHTESPFRIFLDVCDKNTILSIDNLSAMGLSDRYMTS